MTESYLDSDCKNKQKKNYDIIWEIWMLIEFFNANWILNNIKEISFEYHNGIKVMCGVLQVFWIPMQLKVLSKQIVMFLANYLSI